MHTFIYNLRATTVLIRIFPLKLLPQRTCCFFFNFFKCLFSFLAQQPGVKDLVKELGGLYYTTTIRTSTCMEEVSRS